MRDEQAARDHKPVDDSALDPRLLQLDAARDALRRAAKLAPDLWRAHYYLGRLYRDRDDARHAAEQFTAAIKTHPSYRFAYIALIELYRKWDYIDEALAVALAGTANVAPSDASDVWFEVGMAHLGDEPPDPCAARDDAPPGLSAAVLSALAKEPDDRPASATAYAEMLIAAVGSG